jgi:hypothetical protein
MVRRLRAHLAVAGPTTASAIAGRAGAVPSSALPPSLPPRPVSPRLACARAPVSLRAPVSKRRIPEWWPSHGVCLRPR